jgi:hypothetical protein
VKLPSIKKACEAYMGDAETCPYCGGEIMAGEQLPDDSCIFVRTSCQSCGAEFTETFRREGVTVDKTPAKKEVK